MAAGLSALLLALTALALLAPPPRPAYADGDPASDVLLGESVFYPYSPSVSASVQKALNAETAAAARARFPLKVALIASPIDLGVIPSLFNQPQKYADFLDQEISFQGPQPLLVVMPAGYGVHGLPAAATAAARTLAKPASGQSDDLARAALTAVPKLAGAAGHPIQSQSGSSGSSGSVVIVAAVGVVAVVLAAGILAFRRRGDLRR